MHRSLAYLLYFVLSSNPAALRLLKNDMHDDVYIYIYIFVILWHICVFPFFFVMFVNDNATR